MENETNQLNTIAYTLWGVIHQIPAEVIIGMVMKKIKEDQVGIDLDQFETIQDWKNYLHDLLFFEEVRNQGLDDVMDIDWILEYYEETWNNI